MALNYVILFIFYEIPVQGALAKMEDLVQKKKLAYYAIAGLDIKALAVKQVCFYL